MNNATSAAFGPVTMYAANDPAVVDPQYVMEGTSNLGVGGTLDVTALEAAAVAADRTSRIGTPGVR
jgi:hypothetical protein